jgi:nucleotide-binding universal stress UspA family protein
VAVAGALGREFGATVEALHVESLEAPPYFTVEQVKALEAQRKNARTTARRYLARFVEQHGAEGAAVVVADGAPAEIILQRALDVDLVVMGTNDRGIAARLWMGSVAERVDRQAAVPVLIVRASDTTSLAEYGARVREAHERRARA